MFNKINKTKLLVIINLDNKKETNTKLKRQNQLQSRERVGRDRELEFVCRTTLKKTASVEITFVI